MGEEGADSLGARGSYRGNRDPGNRSRIAPGTRSASTYFLCHLAFWFPLAFATPFFVALQNSRSLTWHLVLLAGSLAAATSFGMLATYLISAGLSGRWRRHLSLLLLALATVLVVQGNIVHELFEYGELNGAIVNWRSYG